MSRRYTRAGSAAALPGCAGYTLDHIFDAGRAAPLVPRLPHPPRRAPELSHTVGRVNRIDSNLQPFFSDVRRSLIRPTLAPAVQTREVYDATTPEIVASVVGGVNGRVRTRRILRPGLATRSLLQTMLFYLSVFRKCTSVPVHTVSPPPPPYL